MIFMAMTREILERACAVTIRYKGNELSIWTLDDSGQPQLINLDHDHPRSAVPGFGSMYLAPRDTTKLILEMLSVFTGHRFMLEEMAEGSSVERHIREDLIGSITIPDRVKDVESSSSISQ